MSHFPAPLPPTFFVTSQICAFFLRFNISVLFYFQTWGCAKNYYFTVLQYHRRADIQLVTTLNIHCHFVQWVNCVSSPNSVKIHIGGRALYLTYTPLDTSFWAQMGDGKMEKIKRSTCQDDALMMARARVEWRNLFKITTRRPLFWGVAVHYRAEVPLVRFLSLCASKKNDFGGRMRSHDNNGLGSNSKFGKRVEFVLCWPYT
jgi:hypothetical protein